MMPVLWKSYTRDGQGNLVVHVLSGYCEGRVAHLLIEGPPGFLLQAEADAFARRKIASHLGCTDLELFLTLGSENLL